MSRAASSALAGVIRLLAPRSSVGPQGEGHQFRPIGFGAWASAGRVWATTLAAATPAATPAVTLVFTKSRRDTSRGGLVRALAGRDRSVRTFTVLALLEVLLEPSWLHRSPSCGSRG